MSVDIEARVRQANPVSRDEQIDQLYGADTSRRLLSDIRDLKEGRMTETRKSQEDQAVRPMAAAQPIDTVDAPRRLTPGIALAAFLIVIAVGIAVAVAFRANEPDVVSPQTLAASYIEAQNAWDADAATALLAEDVNFVETVIALRSLEANYANYRAIDWRWTVEACTETAAGSATAVTCEYTHQNAWMRALGVEPIPGTYDFVVVDGEITELTHNFNGQLHLPVWRTVRDWVQENHPDDATTVFSPGQSSMRRTPESTALWTLYTKEFVESIAEGGGS